MPRYIIKHLNRHIKSVSLTQSAPAKLRYEFESNIILRSVESSFPHVLFNPIPVDKDTVYGDTTTRIQILDTSQSPIGNLQDADYVLPQKTKKLPLIPLEVLSTNEKALRKCPNYRIKEKKILQHNKDSNKQKNKLLAGRVKKIMERPMPEALNEHRTKFAEQMSKNIAEFEAFCLADESRRLVKKRRQ